MKIPLSAITLKPLRTNMDEEGLTELAQSIREHGRLEPIKLRQAKQLRKVAAYAKKAGEPLAPTVAVLIAAGQEVPEETMKQLGAG